MTIKNKIVLFFSALALLLVALFVDLWWMLDNAHRVSELHLRRYESREVAEELRQSSDDLTRMARTYVVTGDRRFLDYYEQISGIRDGRLPRPEGYQDIYWDYISARRPQPPGGQKISILDLMKGQHFTEVELALLAEAKHHSDELMKLETQAFKAMEGVFPGLDGEYSRVGEPDRELALRLLHGEAYHLAKAEIMADIDRFYKQLDVRTRSEVRLAEAHQTQPMILAIVLSVILMGMSTVGYGLFYKGITVPLNGILSWIKVMQDGTYTFDVENYKKDEIGTLARAFSAMAGKVSEQIAALERLSTTDPLTEVRNRIALDKALYDEKYKFERYNTPCSIILLDVDHFKAVNDVHGHLVGDRVLIKIAELLSCSTRGSDLVGRWGGEEFMVICPNTDRKGAATLAEMIRKRIDEYGFAEVGHITASLGVSAFIQGGLIKSAISAADDALYQAKSEGRNRVCLSAG